jgi:hypothetical protein
VPKPEINLFFAKSTFFHAGQREKKSFFHAEITFFHAAASSMKKSDSSVKKSSANVKKSSRSGKIHEKPDLDVPRWMGAHLTYLELSAGKDKQVEPSGEPTPSTLTLVAEKSLTRPLPLREIRA